MLKSATQKSVRFVIPATVITIAATIALPFLIHAFPNIAGVPMGARLLPLFWAPFLAVVLFHPSVALVASLITPTINRVLTGRPTVEMSILLTLELVTFAFVAMLLYRYFPKFWVTAPISYIIGKLVAAILVTTFGILPFSPIAQIWGSLLTALPGLILLLALNIVVIRVWDN